jgi:N,N-dimethylformamidase
MTRILGYIDRISAAPGESIQVKVSCDGVKHYDANLIRVIHGDINPTGPGYREEPIKLDLGGPFNGRHQAINMGSYGVIDNAPRYNTHSSLGVQTLIWPTLLGSGPQTILCQENSVSQTGFRLFIDSAGAVCFEIVVNGLKQAQVCTGATLVTQRWYLLSADYNADTGIITVFQHPLKQYPKVGDAGGASQTVTPSVSAAKIDAPIMIAARTGGGKSTREHFNGRIEAPKIFSRTLEAREKTNLTTTDCKNLIAAWDFSIGITTDRITDKSAHELHGRLVNLPTRGVAGYAWNGDERCWQNKPEHYAAIHFHDDDLYDCCWETDFEINLTNDITSGVYAVRLHSKKEEYYIPFSIRPPRGKKKAPIAFILPSASYMAYANNRIGIDVSETEIVCGRLLQMNPIDLFMQSHPEIGLCFYDVHNDGSGVYYSSRLRPIVNMQPKHIGHLGGSGSNVWQFNADTHILAWLEHTNQPFDVISDEDLDADGVEVLTGYKAVISGTHPEYYSVGMLDSLQGYLDNGGRLMYMGGNGFYWRISFHPTLPGVIECRKSEDGIRAFAPLPGEFYSSFTGEYTGLWRRNGRPPNALVGIGMVSQGFDYSSSYVMTEASRDPRVTFVFNGVEGPIIGDYGLSGGGAAGLELDATNHLLGTPPNTLVLAASHRHSDLYLMTPEDMDDPVPGLGGSEAEIIRGEMVFFETPAHGAVFSTGSIAWSGSLSHNNYDNDVARVTTNVLHRFLDETPFDPAPDQ